jgi:hypothetical protein
MPLSFYNLRSKIFGSPTNTCCIIVANYILFRESEVSNLCIPISCYEYILRFEIPIKNVLRMKVMKSQQDITGVETCCIFLKSTYLRKIEEELTTSAVFKNEEELRFTLECKVHLDYEWMPDIFKNPPLGHGMLYLISFDDLGLL